MASPPTSAASAQVPEMPVSKGWLTVVRIAALVFLTPVGLFILVASIGLFPFGLLLAAPFAWYVVWLNSRLFGARVRVKEGLAGAVGAGGAIVIIAVIMALLILHQAEEMTWRAWGAASLTVLLSGILPAAAIRTYYTTKREPGERAGPRGAALRHLHHPVCHRHTRPIAQPHSGEPSLGCRVSPHD